MDESSKTRRAKGRSSTGGLGGWPRPESASEERGAGEPAVDVVVKIPGKLYDLALEQQIALKDQIWGYENFENFILAAIHWMVESDGEYLECGAKTGASIEDLTDEELRLIKLVPGEFR